MADFIDPRDVPGALPAPPANFIDPRDVRSAPAEIGTAALRGLYSGVKGAGAVLQAPAERAREEPGVVSRVGKSLEDFGKAGEERNAPQTEQHGGVTNFLSTAAESLGGSVPVLAGAVAGGAAGSVLPGPGSIIGAAVGGGGAAAAQTWHEKYQEGLAKKLPDDKAREYADESAALSGAGMGALSAIPVVGPWARTAVGAGAKTVAEAGANVVGKKFLPEFAKGAGEMIAGNTALGVGQAAGQAKIDEKAGLEGPSAWDAAKAAAMPSLAGSLGFLPLSALHAHGTVAEAAKLKSALENPEAHPLARARAMNAVFTAMDKVDPEAAEAWKTNAMEAMRRRAPIGLDDSWTRLNPELFPELKLLQGPKPIAAGAPQPGPDANAPDVAAMERQNDELWQQRDATEAARQQAPQGPLALPPPGDVAIPMGGPDASTNPFQLSIDHARDSASERNDAMWAERDRVAAQREQTAQQIEQAAPGGTLSSAAAGAVRTGLADASNAARAEPTAPAAEPAKPAGKKKPTPLDLWAREQEPVPLKKAQEQADLVEEMRAESGEPAQYSVVPHPKGGGYMTLPAAHAPAGSEGLRRPGALPEHGEHTFPLDQPAAQKRAADLTNQTGVEHEAVPHPLAREKFAVQPKAEPVQESSAFSEREQPPAVNTPTAEATAPAETRLRATEAPAVQQHFARLTGEPSITAADRHDATQPNLFEKTALHAALKHLEDSGADTSRLGSLSGIHTSVGMEKINADGGYSPETGTLLVSPKYIRQWADHPDGPRQLAMLINHELYHHADHTEEGRRSGKDDFHSSTDPRFEISPAGPDGREVRGDLATEAHNAYLDKSNPFSKILEYPFASLHDDPEVHGATDREWRSILQNEVFAQLGMAYDAYPEAMQQHLPLAYHFFQGLNNDARQRGIPLGEAYARKLGRNAGAGGEGSVRANGGRAQEGAGDHAAVRYSAGRATGLRDEQHAAEVKSEELRGDGRGFTKFFTDATTGGRKPNTGRQYEPVLDIGHAKDFSAEYAKHRGNFDDHIATSIPGFREVQQAVGNAIVKALPNGGRVVDIGASEGSFIKAITAVSGGKIKTTGVDPNPAMAQFFKSHSKVEGSHYSMSAFGSKADEGKLAWEEENGKRKTKINYYQPLGKFDVAHEAMTFQFISDARDAQVARVKELLKDGGVALFEQKFTPEDAKVFKANEAKKDEYKARYYSTDELERKKKDVLERGAEAHAADEKAKEEKVVGMHNLMVSPESFEKTLGKHFEHVVQYWDSGNFKGYAASDDPKKLSAIVSHLTMLGSEFSTVETPRQVKGVRSVPDDRTLVNIGLDTNDKTGIKSEDAIKAIRALGVDVRESKVHKSDSEQTLVARLARPLTPDEAHKLSADLKQEAIAQVAGGRGELHGPNKAKWMPFNEDYFVGLDGKRLGDRTDETVSPRNPTGVSATENPLTQKLQVGLDSLKKDPEAFKHNVELMHSYPNFARKTAIKEPAAVAERMIKHMVDNLLWLHDQVPEAIRQRSKLWYDGAHKIATDWSGEYGVRKRTVAGIMAVLSPQKDWFMNVSLARRVLDIVTKHKDTKWTPEMEFITQKVFAAKDKPILDAIRGKKYSDLSDPIEKAAWLRTYDEAHNPREYPVVHPEGDFGEPALNDDGKSKSSVAWGSFPQIAKAISIFENQSLANIHEELGAEHKVRSFYNNIIDPNSKGGHLTNDTHAVAAALLRPLSGESREVKHNFGSNHKPFADQPGERGPVNSIVHGNSGTYGMYAEAYRRAAEQRGVLPREMQSITWEAVRGLFTAGFKSQQKNIDAIEKIWHDYATGKIDLNETRQRIKQAAGGIDHPAWWGSPDGVDGKARHPGDARELPESSLPGEGPESSAGGGGGPDAGLSAQQRADLIVQERTYGKSLDGLPDIGSGAPETGEPRFSKGSRSLGSKEIEDRFKPESIRRDADAIAKMDADTRDNTEIGDFPGASTAYNLYEARKLLPKPSDKLKRVTERSTFSLYQDYDYIANVDGEHYGISKYEDPDNREGQDEALDKFVFAYTKLDNARNAPMTETQINTANPEELIQHIRSKGADVRFAKGERDLSAQTDTPQFKKWFGKSQVVGTRGEPLRVYHATSAKEDFAAFNTSPEKELGAHFGTVDQANAVAGQEAGSRVIPAYLSLKKVYEAQEDLGVWSNVDEWKSYLKHWEADGNGPINPSLKEIAALKTPADVRALFESRGFDGIKYPNAIEGREDTGGAEQGDASYIAFHPEQIKSAIGNNGEFSRANPDIRYSNGDRTLRANELEPKATTGKAAAGEQQFTKRGEPVEPKDRAVGPIHTDDMPEWVRSLPPEGQEALRKAGIWVAKKSLRDRWNEYKHEAGMKIIQGTVDQFRPVLEKIGEYPYKLLRMASSSSGALDQSLRSGHIEMNDWGALQIKKGTKGLLDTLKPLGNETDRFLAWIAGNRAARLMAEDKEHNFTKEQIAYLQKLNGKLHPEDAWKGEGSRAMTYAAVLKDWNGYSKSILDIAERSGLIDAEGRKQWEHDFYVPFYRHAENTGPEGGNISGMVNKQAFKKLKGGEEELKDLLANSLGNWAHLLDASMRNNAAWQTLQHAEESGIASRIKEAEAAKGDVFVMQDGKKVYYRVHDPLVLDAISSLSAAPLKGPVMKALSTFKNVLTHGVTLSPTFRIRNVIRDQISALAVNDVSHNFISNIIDGFKYSAKDNPAYADMQAGGAFMHLAHNAEGGYAEHVKRLIAEGVDKATILDSPNKVSAMFRHAYEWWEETGERSESLTRATLYRQAYAKAIEQGMPPERAHFEAAYAARDSMDFGLRGTWPAVRMLSQVVPFMNARLQGLYKLGRGAGDDPKRFAAVVGGVTLATIALSLANRNDKEIQNLPDSDHDNNWIFRVGDKVFRIPKPFEIGALGTIADRGLTLALDGFKPAERELFAQRLMNVVGQQLNMNPIPQAVWPAIQLWANYDSFRGAAIESARDQNLTTAQRIGPSTSATAQLLGKAEIASPEQIDFLVNAYLGWVGSHAVATADLALRPLMGLPGKPAPRVDDYFLVGDFVHQLPSNQSRFVEKFYQHLKDVQQTGQVEQAAAYAKAHKNEIALAGLYTRTQRELAQVNKRARYVQMRTEASMTADEKRAELNRIAQLKLRLTEQAESLRAQQMDR